MRWGWLVVMALTAWSPQRSQAATAACPLMLYDGTRDANGVTFTFRNQGKLPLRQLDFNCIATTSRGRKTEACHSETGVFFPGNPYTINFSYTAKAGRRLTVAPTTAIFAAGNMWTSKRDQPCHSLPITVKKQ